MKAWITTVAAAVAAAAAMGAHAQTRWELSTGYAASSFQTLNVQQFADEVDKATGGRLTIRLHANGSRHKAHEIKRAVQAGAAQAGEFLLSAAADDNPLYGIDAIPFLATSYEESRRLYEVSRAALEDSLAKDGLKLLFSVPWPGQSLYSVKPINGPADFRGTRMRAHSSATVRIAQLLNAEPSIIQLADLNKALASGAADNFLSSSASGIENHLFERARFFYPVNAWLPRNATVVNASAFAALDQPTQQAVLMAAAAAESRGWAISIQKDRQYQQELSAKGMQVAPPSPALIAELRTIGDTLTREWLATAGAEGRRLIDAFNTKR